MSSLQSFEDLHCWKAAREIRLYVSENIIPKMPVDEKYALISQIRRSSRSVSDNISEGFGRFHFQENIQFCRIARGSLCETLNQVITANDENYIDDEILNIFRVLFDKTKSLINGYINYLSNAKNA